MRKIERRKSNDDAPRKVIRNVSDLPDVLQDVECRIYGQSASGQNIEIKQTSRVPPGDTQMVRISIGELGTGNYRFEAKGLTPIEFTVSVQN